MLTKISTQYVRLAGSLADLRQFKPNSLSRLECAAKCRGFLEALLSTGVISFEEWSVAFNELGALEERS